MLLSWVTLCVAISAVGSEPRGTVCYLEGGEDWCFHNDYPFDNMPLPESPFSIEPTLTLFTRDNPVDGQALLDWSDGQMTINLDEAWTFDPNKRTIFMVHGYTQGGNTGWLHDMKDGILAWADVNAVIVGWFHGSMKLWYPQAAANTQIVGAIIADVANEALKMGSQGKDLWCVGHSLGSHLCGHAGRRTDQPMGRITGLDPAGPWFEGRDTSNGLAPDCATFVDAWHTHGQPSIILNLGTFEPRGHVDFYPNGGGEQPGCIIDPKSVLSRSKGRSILPDYDWTLVCSHMRVLYLFMESLQPGCDFQAEMQCYDAWNIPAACWNCNGICQIMGPEAEHSIGRGLFYIKTERSKPYCIH